MNLFCLQDWLSFLYMMKKNKKKGEQGKQYELNKSRFEMN